TGDANLDLVVANFNSANVSFYRGNGDGTFGAPTNFPTGSGAVAVTSGAFNNDTHLDVAVANYSAGTVSIPLGDGMARFKCSATTRAFPILTISSRLTSITTASSTSRCPTTAMEH